MHLQVLDTWDILYQQKAPILSTKVFLILYKKRQSIKIIQVADEPLNVVKVHEQVGLEANTSLTDGYGVFCCCKLTTTKHNTGFLVKWYS